MAQAYSFLHAVVRYVHSEEFVKRCADEFHWKDLSEDVVMDIGCVHFRDRRIEFCVGDVLERDSLKSYEGKMNKIISTNAFHQIDDKERAFRNVYRLLKPGGEAGFFFCVKSYTHKFLTDLSEMPKFREMLEDTYTKDMYPLGHGKEYYKKMLEKVGFKDVRSVEVEKRFCFPTDKDFIDSLFYGLPVNPKLSPEVVQTLKKELIELHVKKFGRYAGKLFYLSEQLNLLGVKPMEG
ncbi:hypothetical protein TNIN_351911 [Trichonephila inaurata madagascariensis]|uniref:Methyltransferase domain-containing protein n=1 Tax=Trichonephila inaurata madagascariensis TaxID=2747483 RepID=A0A8X6YAA6_9ARAC|nr:hypothetical protein TNIN_351911 [Trichonephila inaurata madagascariensis]